MHGHNIRKNKIIIIFFLRGHLLVTKNWKRSTLLMKPLVNPSTRTAPPGGGTLYLPQLLLALLLVGVAADTLPVQHGGLQGLGGDRLILEIHKDCVVGAPGATQANQILAGQLGGQVPFPDWTRESSRKNL